MAEPKYRKVIHISADDSPNVKYAHDQISRGEEPTNHIVIPGIISYEEYMIRERMWDEIRKCISLRGQFWKGKESMMYPIDWLHHSLNRARELRTTKKRTAKALACDPGEGTANTSWCCVDESGIIELVSKVTPDTTEITRTTIAIGNRTGCPDDMWVFDRGGGGKQHADVLRSMGYDVSTIAFGEPPATEPKHGIYTVLQRLNIREEKSAYVSRRAQMYYEARFLLNPDTNELGFGIPPTPEGKELIRQLSKIPLMLDQHGRIYLPSKNRRIGQTSTVHSQPTLTEIIGRSPDEADAFVMAVHKMLYGEPTMVAGVPDDDELDNLGMRSNTASRIVYSQGKHRVVDSDSPNGDDSEEDE